MIGLLYLANRSIKQLAEDENANFSLGAEVFEEDIYVDDVLSGGHTLDEASQKALETDDLAKCGCIPLRKWFSNDPAVLSEIPVDFHAADSKSLSDPSVTTSELGLSWNPTLYVFYFKVLFDPVSIFTERIVLSRTAQVFDSMGWLSHIIITAKILMQSLWLVKAVWDDESCDQHRSKCLDWENKLHQISKITLPRWNKFSPTVHAVYVFQASIWSSPIFAHFD